MGNPLGLERVRTQSKVINEDDEDPPTPVSEQNADYLIDEDLIDAKQKKDDEPFTSLRKQANDRLNKQQQSHQNDVALALLSHDSMNESNQQQNVENDASPSNDKAENDPFSSIEAEFNKLNSVIIEDKPKPNELKKSQSGNEVIKPQKIEKNELEKKNDPFSSIEAEFNSLNNEFDKIQKQQSGNDVVLDMFSSENETNENVKEENVELKPDNDPFAELDMSPNEMFIAPKDEQMNDAKHRKKEDANDPFASLDMAASDIFNSPQKKEKNEKDESAMGVLGGLLSANPEFGNNENIFGG